MRGEMDSFPRIRLTWSSFHPKNISEILFWEGEGTVKYVKGEKKEFYEEILSQM